MFELHEKTIPKINFFVNYQKSFLKISRITKEVLSFYSDI